MDQATVAKPRWSDIAADPDVQKLNAADYDALRRTYFDEVIAPELGADEITGVWTEFDGRTSRNFVGDFTAGAKRLDSATGGHLSLPPEALVGDFNAGAKRLGIMGADIANEADRQSRMANEEAQQRPIQPRPPSLDRIPPEVQDARDQERIQILQEEAKNPAEEPLVAKALGNHSYEDQVRAQGGLMNPTPPAAPSPPVVTPPAAIPPAAPLALPNPERQAIDGMIQQAEADASQIMPDLTAPVVDIKDEAGQLFKAPPEYPGPEGYAQWAEEKSGSEAESGTASDIGHSLKIGANVAAQDTRELISRIPGVGPSIVSALDAVDQYWSRKPSEQLLKEDSKQQAAAMSPESQDAMRQDWWDEKANRPGPALTNWRSWVTGLAVNIPEQAVMMFPVLRLARTAEALALARGATKTAASKIASRTAYVAGGLTEGALQGAQSGRQVRDDILAMNESDLKDSVALGELMKQGMSFDQARQQLAEDASTQAFLLAGVATSIFGGAGDAVLAKAIRGGLSGSIAKRAVKGAVAEGVVEELPQSYLSQVGQNVAMQEAKPGTPLTAGAMNQGVAGLALGSVQGGAQTAVFGRSGVPSEQRQPGAAAAPKPTAAVEPELRTEPTVASTPEPTLQTAPVQDTAEPALKTAPEAPDTGPTLQTVPDVDAAPKSDIEIAAEPLQQLFTTDKVVNPPDKVDEEPHEFASTQTPLPGPIADQVKKAAATLIAPEDVFQEKGLEDRPHITIKYGLHDATPEQVKPLLEGVPPIKAKVTGIEIFQPDEKDYDVVVARVDSPEMVALNKKIEDALPNTKTHPVYHPHITLGYVKRGMGEKYADSKTGLEGQELTLDTVEVADRDENITALKLTGAPVTEPVVEEEPLKAYKSADRAKLEANKLTRQGAPSKVIPHPTEQGKFAVVEREVKPRSESQKANDARLKLDRNTVNPARDSLHAAIGKLGGLNRAKATSEWGIDKAERPSSGVIGKPVLRNQGGLSPDGMLEALAQYGYVKVDENGKADLHELEELFDKELRGEKVYTPQGYERLAARTAEEQALNDQEEPNPLPEAEFTDEELVQDGYNDLTDEEQVALNEFVADATAKLGDEAIAAVKERVWDKSGGMHPRVYAAALRKAIDEEFQQAQSRKPETSPRSGAQPDNQARSEVGAVSRTGESPGQGSAGEGVQTQVGGERREAARLEPGRRTDLAQRARVSEMTHDEARAALLTHELTGLPNRRALKEAAPKKRNASIDIDGLKGINDLMGHESGDQMLRNAARVFEEVGIDIYHVAGDEFIALADDDATIDEAMAKAAKLMENLVVQVTRPDGTVITKTGIGFSYGKGDNLAEADRNLQADKDRREASGARTRRGDRPGGVVESPAKGKPDNQDQSQDVRIGGYPVAGLGDKALAVAARAAATPEQRQAAQEEIDRRARPALDLAAPSEADLKKTQDAAEAKSAATKKTEEDDRLAREKKEIAERSKTADFTLESTEAVDKKTQAEADKKKAEAQLAGQADLLSMSAADHLRAAATKMDEATNPEKRPAAREVVEPTPDTSEPGNAGAAPGREGGGPDEPLMSRAPIFYSELLKQVEALSLNSAPAEQWKATIGGLKNKGIKADEIEWSGVNDFLALQTGKVTKESVLSFLRENGVTVEETELTAVANIAYNNAAEREARLHEDSTAFWRDKVEDAIPPIKGVDRANLPWWAFEMVEPEANAARRDDAEAKARAVGLDDKQIELLKEYGMTRVRYLNAQRYTNSLKNDSKEGGRTKFETYTLPGGENYRELLLTLPIKNVTSFEAWVARSQHVSMAQIEERGVSGIFGDQTARSLEAQYQRNLKDGSLGADFRSSHFDQPNILAHIRFNERADANGKKVLFIEEIQSDWAQKGKREGFSTQYKQEDITLLPDSDQAAQAPDRFWYFRVPDNVMQIPKALYKTEEDARRHIMTKPRGGSVPPAPFVGKTEAWVGLALKRMMRYAAENGFDRIAWTTGAQQAARYDLSKHIDRIDYSMDDDGTYSLSAIKDGREVIQREGLDRKGVEDLVGKDVAEKMVMGEGVSRRTDSEEEYRSLSGLDLKVGGEGMRAFYDKIVPNVVNDVLKKLGGGRVSDVAMNIAPESEGRYGMGAFDPNAARIIQRGNVFQVLAENPQSGVDQVRGGNFDSREAAEAFLKSGAVQSRTQPGFSITPAMKEKALGGVPLFRRDASQSSGLSVSVAQSHVDKITAKWKNPPLGGFKVVANVEALPKKWREWVESKGASGDVQALYVPGEERVYLIADQLASTADLEFVVFHETLGHAGLRGILSPDRYKLEMRRAYQNKNVRAAADKLTAQYGYTQDLATEEALADMAGKGSNFGVIKQLIVALQTALRKIGLNSVADMLEGMTDAEVSSLLSDARKFVTEGPHAYTREMAPAMSRGNDGGDSIGWMSTKNVIGSRFSEPVEFRITDGYSHDEKFKAATFNEFRKQLNDALNRFAQWNLEHRGKSPIYRDMSYQLHVNDPSGLYAGDKNTWVQARKNSVFARVSGSSLFRGGAERAWGSALNTAEETLKLKLFLKHDIPDLLKELPAEKKRPALYIIKSDDTQPPGPPSEGRGVSGDGGSEPAMSRAGQRAAGESARGSVLDAYRRVAKRAIDGLDRIADPFVTLPDRKAFMAKRGLTQGLIDNTNDLTKAIRKAFLPASTEDRKAVFAYLITAGANTDTIAEPKIQQAAKDAKDLIRKVGDELVNRGMLDEATRRDSYLPQVYLKYLLDTKDFKRLGSGKKPSSMEYLLKRKYEMKVSDGKVTLTDRETGKPVPDETVLSLGPVTDPTFLSGLAVARPMRDIALMDWLKDISKNVNWILPGTTVEWEGKTVSPYWLKEEAARMKKQARYYSTDPNVQGGNQVSTQGDKALIKKDSMAGKAIELAERMDAVADEALEGLPNDRERFRQMPNTARMGHMRGIWVREEIFNDIMGIQDMIPTHPGWAQDLFGYGGRGTKAVQLWKMSKVTLNFPGQVRNFVSNGVLLTLSGVPIRSLPRLMVRATDELINNGQHWKIAKKYGVRASTFSAQELQRLKTEYLDIERQAGNLGYFGTLSLLGRKTANAAGDVYQLSEALFKTAKIIHEMERSKKAAQKGKTDLVVFSPEEKNKLEASAVDEAQKWLFDYSNVPKSVRYLRGAPVGVPFITFSTKVLPRLAEVTALHPQRWIPWVGLIYGLQYGLAALLDVDYDDLEKLKKAMPEWIQKAGHAVLLPFKDELGRWQVVDLGYFMPWTFWTTIGKDLARGEIGEAFKDTGAVAGPMVDLATAWKTGIDPFTKREIANPADPAGMQALSWLNYHYSMVAPPMLTDRGTLGKAIEAYTGETNKFGDSRRTASQAALSLFGVNVNAIEPEQTRAANETRMKREIDDSVQRVKNLMTDRSMNEEERTRLRERYTEEIRKRGAALQQYQKDSAVHPKLATP